MKFSIDKIGIDIVWQEDSVYIAEGGSFSEHSTLFPPDSQVLISTKYPTFFNNRKKRSKIITLNRDKNYSPLYLVSAMKSSS